jgi:hypothetical protein
MIYENDAKEFAGIMYVTWANYGKGKPDRDTLRYWFDTLAIYDIDKVGNAFDAWIKKHNDKMPTIKDILDTLKPKPDYMTKLAKPKPDKEVARKHLAHIKQILKINDRNDDAR